MKWLNRFLIVLVFALLIFLCLQKIHCYDYFGHLAYGRYIFENKTLPLKDVFSHSAFGEECLNFSWIHQIVFYIFYLIGKTPGAIIGKTLIILGAFLLYFRLGHKRVPIYLWLCVFMFGILTAQTRFFVRPQCFTFLFIGIYFYIFKKYTEGDKKLIYWLPVVQLIWVNTHSVSLLGPVILLTYLVGEVVIRNINLPFEWNQQKLLANWQMKELAMITGICLLVGFINPYGYKLYTHYGQMFAQFGENIQILPGGIHELQPIVMDRYNWWGPHVLYFKMFVLLTGAVIVAKIRTHHISTLTLYFTFFYLARMIQRNVALFAIVGLWTVYMAYRLENEKDN